ncbi:MAG: CPBP family intramembrane metalloprotease, partial [Bacteroidia bacterium]|nr:CPBP family intramembrane metalloprotease [Bacteroidia bacterium]
ILINHYLKRGLNVWRSVMYSSLLFGGLHLIALVGKSDPVSVINQSLIAIMLGIFLSGVFLCTRNIYMTGLFHAFVNIPTYFKIDENTKIETASAPLFESPFLDIIASSLILILIYSPSLFAGFWLVSKVKDQSFD